MMQYYYKGESIRSNAPVSFSASAASLASGTHLVCAESMDNEKNAVVTATAFFNSFDSMTVAHGYRLGFGNWCVVDGTNVTVWYGSSLTKVAQAAHGLAITGFLTVSIRQGRTTDAVITLTTAGGTYETSVDHWLGSNGSVELFGTQDMTDAQLTYGLADAGQSVYVFADSYATAGDPARWPSVLADAGCDGFLLCGHGGGRSLQLLPQFETLIGQAQPKLAVWMLGMNDADSTSGINADWKTCAERFISVCKAKGITPVLTTIPNVPSCRHVFKNDWIRQSGCRYVDWAKAVGAEQAGASWYAGMLSSDNVHPTALGAQVLAARLLLDVPELAGSPA